MRRPLLGWIALLALAGGCTGPATTTAPRGRVVKPSELPAEHRGLLEAYGAGGAAWEAARARATADPALLGFLVDNLVIEMVRGYVSLAGAGAGSGRGEAAFDRAQAELVRLADASTPVLAELLTVPDGVVATLAADTLEQIGRPAVAPVSALLAAPDVATRRRAAGLLGRLPHGAGAEEQARLALAACVAGDEDWVARAESARALGRRGARDRTTEPARAALVQALQDPDPAVSQAAAQGLALLQDPLAIPSLIGALARAASQGQPRLVTACQGALSVLSGEPRTLDVAGWRSWWLEHQDEIRRRSRP